MYSFIRFLNTRVQKTHSQARTIMPATLCAGDFPIGLRAYTTRGSTDFTQGTLFQLILPRGRIYAVIAQAVARLRKTRLHTGTAQ